MYNILVKKFLYQKQIKQSSLLLFSTIVGMGFSFINSTLVARLLGVSQYGDFKFIQTVWVFLSLLSSFGLFHAASRVIVLETSVEIIAELIGATFLLTIGVSLLMLFASILLARPLDLFFHTNLASVFIVLSPLLLAFSLQSALPLILQANNRIGLLAFFTVFPQVLNTIFTVFMLYKGFVSIIWTSIAQLGSILTVSLMVIWQLKPVFRNIMTSVKKIFYQNKIYGIDIFTGSLGAVGSSQLNRLAVAYWVDNTALGFLSLAIVLTEPLKLLPNVIATSSFRKFAEQKNINKRILWGSVFISIVFWVIAIVFYNNFLQLLYPKGFESVKFMAMTLSIGAIMHGFGDFYNRFLGAQGQGISIRNSAYIVGIVNIVAALVLPPLIGIDGALVATLLGNFTYFALMFYSYKKFSSKTEGLK